LDPEYQSGIAPEDLRVLGLDETRQPLPGEEALYLAILSCSTGNSFTANLLAPVIIHRRARSAIQAVRHDQLYSHCHPLPRGLLEHLCS
jgi:flagellar assembly factor FliW